MLNQEKINKYLVLQFIFKATFSQGSVKEDGLLYGNRTTGTFRSSLAYFFIAVAFYALQAFRFDQLFKKGRTFQIQLIYILFSIVIGSAVSNFFITFSQWSRSLVYIFQ